MLDTDDDVLSLAAQFIQRNGRLTVTQAMTIGARAMAAKWTVSQIAGATGFERSSVLKWLTGRQRPSTTTCVRLVAWAAPLGLVNIMGEEPPLDPAELRMLVGIRAKAVGDTDLPNDVRMLLGGDDLDPLRRQRLERWATAESPIS